MRIYSTAWREGLSTAGVGASARALTHTNCAYYQDGVTC